MDWTWSVGYSLLKTLQIINNILFDNRSSLMTTKRVACSDPRREGSFTLDYVDREGLPEERILSWDLDNTEESLSGKIWKISGNRLVKTRKGSWEFLEQKQGQWGEDLLKITQQVILKPCLFARHSDSSGLGQAGRHVWWTTAQGALQMRQTWHIHSQTHHLALTHCPFPAPDQPAPLESYSDTGSSQPSKWPESGVIPPSMSWWNLTRLNPVHFTIKISLNLVSSLLASAKCSSSDFHHRSSLVP